MKEYNDKLNDIIVDRLKEQHYKLGRIKEMEKRTISFHPLISIAIATCVVGVLYFAPWKRNEVLYDEATRAAVINIDSLIGKGKLDEALVIIDNSIAETNNTIKQLKQEVDKNNNDETNYLIQAEQMNIEELQKKKKYIMEIKRKSK